MGATIKPNGSVAWAAGLSVTGAPAAGEPAHAWCRHATASERKGRRSRLTTASDVDGGLRGPVLRRVPLGLSRCSFSLPKRTFNRRIAHMRGSRR